jgi:hypothetical protein
MNNKLFSTIYILGTAIAIAFTMVIAEIYYVKVADIAPEVNRSRTYTVNFAASLQNKNEVTMIGHWLQHELTTSMQAPDCATAVAQLYNPENYYIRQRDGLRDRRVNAIVTDPAFFRFYQFRFVNGAPFTEDDMDSRRNITQGRPSPFRARPSARPCRRPAPAAPQGRKAAPSRAPAPLLCCPPTRQARGTTVCQAASGRSDST